MLHAFMYWQCLGITLLSKTAILRHMLSHTAQGSQHCSVNKSMLRARYFFYYWWGGTKCLGTAQVPRYCGHFWPIVQTPDDRWGWFWSNCWNEDWQGKPKYSEKTCPSATLSTTKSHMTRPGLELRTAAVGSQRLTAWVMGWPCVQGKK
jgi:hypothetical protein